MKKQLFVNLPVLHEDQVKVWQLPGRFKAVRCGRRWGKTTFGIVMAADCALKGQPVGWFAPSYRLLSEAYVDMFELLQPVTIQHAKPEVLRLITRGQIDFWTLENETCGRGRKYRLVIIDEGAFTRPDMLDTWNKAIKPTLLDYGGEALVLSNTNGADPDNFMWRICNEAEHGFVQYHAPTHANPMIPLRREGESDLAWQQRRKEEFDKIRADHHPLVYQQEYLAEFVDWAGSTFFDKDKLLVLDRHGNRVPLEAPEQPDVIFAVLDTAVKSGKANDGTAVVYASYATNSLHQVVILDWDLVQIEGALLEKWLPTVFKRLDMLVEKYRPRIGQLGVWIEDRAAGTVLLQQARRNGWAANEITNALTVLGKDERAINVSGYVYQEKVKFARPAWDKTITYKRQTRNHLLDQLMRFRIGDPDAKNRPDDLLDAFCYTISLALGNRLGF